MKSKQKFSIRMLCIPLLLLILGGKAYGQQLAQIKGTVIDESGEFLTGVTISATNSIAKERKTVSTNSNGVFTITGLQDASKYQLTFSHVSYQDTTIYNYQVNANTNNSLQVRMILAVSGLDQIVVVGYGTQRKKDLTGSITSVKSDEVKGQAVVSGDQLLQGRAAGVNVTNASGMPGAGVRVSVRGIGSINGSNEPLYVIDGIPVTNGDPSPFSGLNGGGILNPLSAINPNDIESIEVLKDAAAASIYGSRATNGVVIITTKRGKSGKSIIEYSGYYGFQNLPKTIELANTETYFNILNEARTNYNKQNNLQTGISGFLTPLADPRTTKEPDTDWIGLLTNKNAPITNHDMSISGGTNKTKFYTSLNYFKQDGIIKTNSFDRISSRLNIDHEVSDKIKIGVNISLSKTENHRVPNDLIGNAILMRGLEQRPYDKPYKPQGTYTIGGQDILRHNGVTVLNEKTSRDKTYKALIGLNASIKLIKGLEYKPAISAEIVNVVNYLYNKKDHPYAKPLGVVYDYRNLAQNYIIDNMFTYTKQIKGLSVNALAGHSYQHFTLEDSYIEGRDFPSPAFGYLSSAGRILSAPTGFSEFAIESYIARLNLGLEKKYLFTLALRNDGSSRFAKNKKYGTFPSAALAWIITNEKFASNINWLSNLKLRLSYGLTGNQDGIGNFASYPLTTAGHNYNQQIGIAVTQVGNQNLVWEKANQFNIGFDADILKSRINASVDYFIKNTNNLLFDLPVQATSGFTSQTLNIGSMQNKGFEFAIKSININGVLKWNTNLNISMIENKLTKLISNNPIPFGPYHLIQVGHSIGTFYMLKQEGIYQTDTDVPTVLFNKGIRAGDIKFEDINKDGNIDAADRQVVGKATPDFFGGITNSFEFKNFDLSAFIQFSKGNNIFAFWRGNNSGDGIDAIGGNQFAMLQKNLDKRWTAVNTSTEIPRAIWPTANGNFNKQISTRFLEDGSFIRLKTISLGYNLPTKLLQNIKLNQLRIFITGQNLITFSKYLGYDPEVSYSIDPRNLGIDAATVPQSKTITFGLNIKF